MVISLGLIVLGIALLFGGGELLVENAKKLAFAFGMSAMAVGLTVVAFATSAPELAAALTANLKGSPDLAVGNAVGSNIANVGLILGATALFFTLPATTRFLRREMAFMIVVTVICYPLMLSGLSIGRIEGAFMFTVLVLFIWFLLRDPDHQLDGDGDEDAESGPIWIAALGVVGGVFLLVGGAQSLVIGASDIARAMGISERVIGLTILAIGTSLPELAASLVAGRKGETDLIMGNIVGSNIFNLLCILGLTAVVSPLQVAPAAMSLDYWMMLGISLLLLIFLSFTRRLTKVEGFVLLTCYTLYSVYLFVG